MYLKYIFIPSALILVMLSSETFANDNLTSYTSTNIVKTVTAIAVDDDYVWLGTDNGMACYNKATGASIPYTIADGLAGNSVKSIAVEKSGIIWIATDGGISRFDGATFTTYTDEPGATDILGAAVDYNNVKWFISNDTLIKYNDVSWEVYTADDGLPTGSLTTIAIDRRNTVWIGTSLQGIISFDGQLWRCYTDYLSKVVSIAVDSGNTLWFGDYRGSVISFDGAEWSSTQVISSMWHLNSCAVDSNDVLWCGTQRGLYRIDKGETRIFTENDGLIKSYGGKIVTDKDGILWIGGYRGLVRFDGTQFTNFLGYTGPSGKTVCSIAIDQDNVKWFGHNASFASSFDDYNWSGIEIDLYNNIGETIAVDKDNVKWFSAGWDGIILYDGNKITKKSVKGHTSQGAETEGFDYSLYTRWITANAYAVYFSTSLENDDLLNIHIPFSDWNLFHAPAYKYVDGIYTHFGSGIVSISTGANNDVWAIRPYNERYFPDDFGVYRYTGEGWSQSLLMKNIGITLTKIYVDPFDIVWGLSNRTLLYYDGSEWIKFSTGSLNQTGLNIRTMAVDHNNTKWIGTDAGIARFDGETWTTFNTQNSGLCDDNVNAIAVEKNNTIWFGTDNGISRYTGEVIPLPSDVEDTKPEAVSVLKTFPNPFNPSTTIEFALPEAGFATLVIYNMAGQKVRELTDGYLTAGIHRLQWDGKDNSGNSVSAGVYIARLKLGEITATGKLVLVK